MDNEEHSGQGIGTYLTRNLLFQLLDLICKSGFCTFLLFVIWTIFRALVICNGYVCLLSSRVQELSNLLQQDWIQLKLHTHNEWVTGRGARIGNYSQNIIRENPNYLRHSFFYQHVILLVKLRMINLPKYTQTSQQLYL